MPTKKLAEASRYKSRYGASAINTDFCRAAIFGDAGGCHQCSHKAKPGTEWCGVHSPEAIAKREEKREVASRKWRADWNARTDKRMREDRLVEGAEKMLAPEAWFLCAAEIVKALDEGAFPCGGGPSELSEVIAKHARKILGEETS